jgi:hypothetical protein
MRRGRGVHFGRGDRDAMRELVMLTEESLVTYCDLIDAGFSPEKTNEILELPESVFENLDDSEFINDNETA